MSKLTVIVPVVLQLIAFCEDHGSGMNSTAERL